VPGSRSARHDVDARWRDGGAERQLAEDLTAELGIPRTVDGEELLLARSQVVLAAAVGLAVSLALAAVVLLLAA